MWLAGIVVTDAVDTVLAVARLDVGRFVQLTLAVGVASFLLAVIAFVWSRLEANQVWSRGRETAIEERVDAIEAERTLTRWAKRLGIVGATNWAAAVVLFMMWLTD